ncbi:glycosyltransferase family 2 protein [Paenibacillus sedimenti]|uniref:Glucosyl-3-phosphoglycerate synthase n=1 Tax=Paenibacillus sedimenti TaxID=2770274 RepID=A0A926QKL6_9BACL|nr:glycosyltransferase [Paenibacillus sedimenti]MBD0381612.1 glycosyltransferase [Paenibacillus sedimenti]
MKRKGVLVKFRKKIPIRRKRVQPARRRRLAPAWIMPQTIHRTGRRFAGDHPLPEGEQPISFINSLWYYYYNSERRSIPINRYAACAEAFLDGYCAQLGIEKPDGVLIPTLKSMAAVITVFNEEETIGHVLEQLRRLQIQEIIVVINGSTDNSFAVTRQTSPATIVHYPAAIGHDVGRSIGAMLTTADMVLFLDGDIPIKAEQLLPFIQAMDGGADVALNDLTPFIGQFALRDGVTMMKEFLNAIQGRSDLKSNSMTAIPHMLSSNAIERIGAANLIVPPKAQSLAIKLGLRICAPASIDVIKENKVTRLNTGAFNPVSNLILGDHLEAMHTLIKSHSSRLGFVDPIRKRSQLRRD